MLKINRTPEFTHEIEALAPADGGHAKETFKARFRVLDDDVQVDTRSADSMKEFLREAVVRFEDIVDDADRPVPYSDELRELVIAAPWRRLALLKAYFEAITKARLGN